MARSEWPHTGARFKVPFTATRQFRQLVLGGAVLGAILLVVIFEIGPLLSRKAPVAAAKDRPVASLARRGEAEVLFDGVLEEVEDGRPVDSTGVAYRHVAAALARAPAPPSLEETPAPPHAFLESPGSLRGETVKIEALLIRSSPIRLDRPLDGREWIHRAYLVDPRADQGLVVDCLERPSAAERTLVAFDGVFLRLATYQGMKGPVQAPFFLAREVREVNERAAKKSPAPGALLVAFAVLSVLGSIFLTVKVTNRRPTDLSAAFSSMRSGRAAGGGPARRPAEGR